jgi:hypothetical protein
MKFDHHHGFLNIKRSKNVKAYTEQHPSESHIKDSFVFLFPLFFD